MVDAEGGRCVAMAAQAFGEMTEEKIREASAEQHKLCQVSRTCSSFRRQEGLGIFALPDLMRRSLSRNRMRHSIGGRTMGLCRRASLRSRYGTCK